MRSVALLLLVGACSFSSGGVDPSDPDGGGPGGPDGPPGVIDAAQPTPDAPFDAAPCGNPVELCNGVDDDCDGTIDEGYSLGGVCDGGDGDLCMEGTMVCALDGVSVECTDKTATTVEVCDGAFDEDCDGAVDEGFDLLTDEANCGACGTMCLNSYGSSVCATGSCNPVCSAGAQDCDGLPNNGCELRDVDPLCTASTTVGVVSGDVTTTYTTSDYEETWIKVSINESTMGMSIPLRVRFDLTNPPGVDYDLFVYCLSCGGDEAGNSQNDAGLTDTVYVGRDDDFGDQSFEVLVEIRFFDATMCGDWTLTVVGNASTSIRNCNP